MGSSDINKRNRQHEWFISQRMIESTLSFDGSFSHFLYYYPLKYICMNAVCKQSVHILYTLIEALQCLRCSLLEFKAENRWPKKKKNIQNLIVHIKK